MPAHTPADDVARRSARAARVRGAAVALLLGLVAALFLALVHELETVDAGRGGARYAGLGAVPGRARLSPACRRRRATLVSSARKVPSCSSRDVAPLNFGRPAFSVTHAPAFLTVPVRRRPLHQHDQLVAVLVGLRRHARHDVTQRGAGGSFSSWWAWSLPSVEPARWSLMLMSSASWGTLRLATRAPPQVETPAEAGPSVASR